jgi:orotidine-5'-phosphate decarboxylase
VVEKMSTKDPLILALDVDSLKEARRFVKLLKNEITFYKVGAVLFTAAGPSVVRMIHDEGGKVFLDLKYHDIPNTVAKACEAAELGIFMLDLHANGGKEMLKAASAVIKKAEKPPLLVGVTVLTSRSADRSVSREVVRLAALCQDSGLNGVVCSPQEIEMVRSRCGKKFVIVTPGIRPAGSPYKDDQKRVATPSGALRSGADYIVVGRPILTASDPRKLAQAILEEAAFL